jgi:hypothetical protein
MTTTMTKPPADREHELRTAIEQARLPGRDYRIFMALFARAEWKTAVLRDRYQPRSLDELAAWCGSSHNTVTRGLADLTLHGWITRTPRKSPGRQGAAISYQLQHGHDCDCRAARKPAMTGAERTRLWRTGIQRQNGVTKPGIQRQNAVTYDATDRHTPAGQAPVSAKRVRDEEELVEDTSLTACRVCLTPMDPVLPRLGYTTHPCCDPDDQGDYHAAAHDLEMAAA